MYIKTHESYPSTESESDQYVNMMKEKYLATACFTVISLLYILYAVRSLLFSIQMHDDHQLTHKLIV